MRRHWGIQVDANSGYYTGTFWEFVNSNGRDPGREAARNPTLVPGTNFPLGSPHASDINLKFANTD
ncbi:hypothetical protein [Actinoplanes sp. GCM10030250]|uniref:hypothetical protein n=1 Tax=Actinoplanes sp. GCM10030250 TaxID=3273376 RepID=UPI003622B591